jgi:hypothetical protein
VLRTLLASTSPVVRLKSRGLLLNFPDKFTGYEGVDPVATINTVSPSTTEFHVACPSGVDSSDCGWGPGLDVTILSQSRFQAEMTDDSFSISLGCDYNSKATEMTCTVNQSGGNDDTGGEPVTAVLSGTDVQFLSASVVKGAELLTQSGNAGPVSTGGAESSTTASAAARSASTGLMTASGTAPVTSVASGSGFMPTASGSAPATASTGAAVRYGIEGSALLALAGAAVVML